MNFATKFAAIGVIASGAVFASGAYAAPGDPVLGNGQFATARFVGFNAADRDVLSQVSGPSGFFVNQTTSIGSSQALGQFAAGQEIRFSITNTSLSPNQTFFSGPVVGPGGIFYANVTDNFAAFPLLSADSQAFAATVQGGSTRFVGFEDRTEASLRDYNDLVFAVTFSTNPATVPEPASLALIGAGLVGLGAIRRRKAV